MRLAPAACAFAAIAALFLAGAAQAQPAEVSVTIGPDLMADETYLGDREVRQRAAELADTVSEALHRSGALHGATVRLTLTDLKPNRPTLEQTVRKPGLSIFDSVSIGGATIEGEVVTADGRVLPVAYDWYTPSVRDVHGLDAWHDADRAFDRFARRLASGRYGV